MKKYTYIYIALSLMGFVMPFVSDMASAIYGGSAFILLAGIQISLLPNSGKWAIIGGKPTAALLGKRKVAATTSIVILVSLLLGLFLKIVWMKYAL